MVNINYYKNAVSNFTNILGNDLKIYVFSDDLEWCKKNLKFNMKINFVEHELAGYKFYDYLYLMSSFKNFIIPNSTFGWWASWLSRYKDKIVMTPERWSGLIEEGSIDIVPPEWIRIEYKK